MLQPAVWYNVRSSTCYSESNDMLQYMLQCTQYCMLYCIIQYVLQCVIQCTIQNVLQSMIQCMTQYVLQCTVQHVLQCIIRYVLQCMYNSGAIDTVRKSSNIRQNLQCTTNPPYFGRWEGKAQLAEVADIQNALLENTMWVGSLIINFIERSVNTCWQSRSGQ